MQQCTAAVAGIGIDVSGAKLDLAIRFVNNEYLDDSFDNNAKGIKSLVSVLRRKETAKTVPLVIESTGNCHLQSALMIKQENYSVKVINPVLTRKYQKSSVRNAKSDKIDARRLADMACFEQNLPDFNGNINDIADKKATSYLSHLEKVRQQLNSSLRQFEQTAKLLKIPVDLKSIKTAIKKIEEQMDKISESLKQGLPENIKKLVSETPGISEKQMAVLLALIGHKQFETKSKLIAYVGLDIALRQSGGWRGKQKLSKRGSGYARKILYQIAWSLKQNNIEYKQYFNRLKNDNKKHYNTAMVATARKFLRFMYAYYFRELNPIS
jgi:transposase